MDFYDVLFTLDLDGRFQTVAWGSEESKKLYHLLFESWVARRRRAASVFPIHAGQESGSFRWDEDTFYYRFLPGPGESTYLLLSREDHRAYLFARALDQVAEGVQIYDKNACAVYFNKVSRKISHIPSGVDPQGRHLLDLYNLDESVSTTMTALRTQSPVINRVDHFKASDDTSIATANTSYPILREGELLGAVVFEQTEEIVQRNIKRMEETQRALKSFASRGSQITFSGYTFENVIGHSQRLRDAVAIAQKVAPQNSSVLLVGETGTGKEIFAQSIHQASPRRGKKFLAINCAAIPETLIESLLFGTQKGSFTGSEDKAGYFEEASGGTLFLDELNSMSLAMQSKILRVIQENTFRRVGGNKDLKLDVRIISSCNEDPFRAIADNQFRRDLFYRLSTVMLELPPLREHLEDLEELVRYHLNATSYQYVHGITEVDPQVYAILRSYHWPGNVRELFHVLDYAQNVADSSTMRPEHLPSYLLKSRTAPAASADTAPAIDFSSATLQSLLDDYEHQIIVQALDHCGGNISRTAQTLGILRQSLQYRIRKYGIVL
ncbi:sigma-54 interaction domain-containing protein [Pseudoflavonifractor phocaeensis]|uniref:sigma-54 interaction domain-containing protein n=1 Tax=Pseudoflavonifractor phocaeensis TaxID=1870988 RepID=UPI001F1F35BE|nr:sigma 54-interacting transcriptional regulator [Pseudoflavonifractor phocaeensis]MCF2595806.1 sigma 54-interacting transcriptional regulator [Pseudoflavonifractor phocaeensis]